MTIQIHKGDITKLNVDVIVNAANSSLLGGGGVDGVIHRAGGAQILEECLEIRNRQGPCKAGDAVMTNAGLLKAKKVIHTVGPIWNNGNSNEAEKLKNCYHNSIMLADAYALKSIAFPNISTGAYGYPKMEAAAIAIATVMEFNAKHIEQLLFVCYDDKNYLLYKNMLNVEH